MSGALRNRPLARGDACLACNNRKIRCSADRPACVSCIRLGRECVYRRYSPGFSPLPATPARHDSSSSSTVDSLLYDIASLAVPPTATPLPTYTPAGPNPSFMLPGLGQGFDDLDAILAGQRVDQGDVFGGQTLPIEYDQLDLSWLDVPSSVEFAPGAQIPPGAQVPPPAQPAVSFAEQQHLLWLYFTNQRSAGVEMHVATFYERLAAADEQDRPHPCLLNAMYLVVCRRSTSEALRLREDEFGHAARTAMAIALDGSDRLLDVVRAGTLVASWLYNAGLYVSACTTLGQTARLAQALGLDVIRSSRVDPDDPHNKYNFTRLSSRYSDASTTEVELADRIYAFWGIFIMDVGAATVQDWPATLLFERIWTPLPRPWPEYENPNEHHLGENDETLQSLIDESAPDGSPSTFGMVIKAIALIYLASTADLCIPRPRSTTAPPERRLAIAARRNDISRAMERFKASLPVHLTTPQSTRLDPVAAVMMFILGGAEMLLLDDYSTDTPNPALAPTRRLVGLLRLMGSAENGDTSLFIIMIWAIMTRLLLLEVARLERAQDFIGEARAVSVGLHAGAATVNAEIDFIVECLRACQAQLPLAGSQAEEITEWRRLAKERAVDAVSAPPQI